MSEFANTPDTGAQTDPEGLTALDERLAQAEMLLAQLTAEKERKQRLTALEAQIKAIQEGEKPKPVMGPPPKFDTFKMEQMPADYSDVKKFLRRNLEEQLKAYDITLRPKSGRDPGNDWKVDSAAAALFSLYVFYKEEMPRMAQQQRAITRARKEQEAQRYLQSIDYRNRLKIPFEP